MAQSAQNQQKLLTIAQSINPEVIGVGQEPPVIAPSTPDVDIALQLTDAGSAGRAYVGIDDSAFSAFKIEPYRIMPIGVFQLPSGDFEGIQDLIDARQLETQLKTLHLTKLYEAVAAGPGSGKLDAAIERMDLEAEDIAFLINALEGMYLTKSDAAAGFETHTLFNAATTRYIINCGIMNVELDPIEQSMNYIDALADLSSIPKDRLLSIPTTAVYYQILADADYTIRYAFTPGYYLPAGYRVKGLTSMVETGFLNPRKDVPIYLGLSFSESIQKDMGHIPLDSVGIQDRSTYHGIPAQIHSWSNPDYSPGRLSTIGAIPMFDNIGIAPIVDRRPGE